MKLFIFLVAVIIFSPGAAAQEEIVIPESIIMNLDLLVGEVIANNPEIQAAIHQWDLMEARIPQMRSLDDPELTYVRMDMPGFRFSEAMSSRIELMQMIMFPSKLITRGRIARIEAEHAHHEHLEVVNDVLLRMSAMYYELWFIQQSIVLNAENQRLLRQFIQTARARYGVGEMSAHDILRAEVELTTLENNALRLRQEELSAKAMLMSILNRQPGDTLGYAYIPEEIIFTASLHTLEALVYETRPMLVHDSLIVSESRQLVSMARQEFIPDFRVGVEYVTSPISGFTGWGVRAGITLPFAPWTLRKATSRVQEAQFAVKRAQALLLANRNMVLANVRSLYRKIEMLHHQLKNYENTIVPKSRNALDASLALYRTGRGDFLMVLDSYRLYVEVMEQFFMTRMKFEQAIAELAREVGYQYVATLKG